MKSTGNWLLNGLAILSLFVSTIFAQVDEAKQAIDRGEYVRAVNILSNALGDRPTADTYLYLGIAYRQMKEYKKAEDVFNEGGNRYSDDPRFHNELANLFLENNDIDAAKSELRRALSADPNNAYASDRLATIDMSEGEVQAALRAWNKTDRPYINDILHNYNLHFGSWVVAHAVAFHPLSTLRYSQWKTSEARLFQTENFTNVGLEIEPTRLPDQYNAVVRTTSKTNSLPDFLFNAVKGAPFQTTFFDLWNIQGSGINFNSNYRWDTNRRRLEGLLKLPLPIAGLVYLELGNTWRKERWNVSPNLPPQSQSLARFDFDANTLRARVKHIPHYRIELAAGYEYRNRSTQGDLPVVLMDSLNTGKLTAEANLRLADGNYQNRLHVEAFAARPFLLGSMHFTGGVAELNNRWTLSKDTRTYFDWTVRGGTTRGALPVDEYFLLGLDTRTEYPLRAHTAARDGRYGNGPMGTDFVLVNTDLERKLATIPLFNSLNIPYLTAKWEIFVDAAKTWDRQHVFQNSKLLVDIGAGLRFETPTHSLNLTYGRALRSGQNVFFAYYERRLW